MSNIDGFFLLTKLIKKKHQSVLQKISDRKFSCDIEKEEFVQEYLKTSFYTPIIGSYSDEQAQFYLLKKKRASN